MESITFYQHIKRQTLWEQLDQRGDTLRRLMSQSNEQHITPCDTHFIVPEPQRETCPFKLLSKEISMHNCKRKVESTGSVQFV